MMKQTLPPLMDEALAHSERVVEHIRAAMAAQGNWLSFEDYMRLALYAPGLGYYSAGARKLGAGGDFVTAPEISPLFGYCLGGQCAQVLASLGDGAILELGAGSGAMAADILTELERSGALPKRYSILEVSADLRERQQARLRERVPHLCGLVEWLDALPESFEGVIVANEVLDALPVQRFVIRNNEVLALGVTFRDRRFEWQEAPASLELREAVRELERQLGYSLPDGYTSEINLGLRTWLESLARSMRLGVMLWIDYGLTRREYYSLERSVGTMLCYYRQHAVADPFARVGMQDIGAWVDFSAVADAAVLAGLKVMGFATQAHFLLGAGIDRYAGGLEEASVADRARRSRQIQQLILPGEMGERFKVMALAKDFDEPLTGFGFRDMRERLG